MKRPSDKRIASLLRVGANAIADKLSYHAISRIGPRPLVVLREWAKQRDDMRRMAQRIDPR